MSGKDKSDKKEEDCECYAKNRSPKACPPIHHVTHPLRYYEFTQDEIKALEECDKESFYRRCLPFSTVFAAITYAAIQKGAVKGNPHFGAVPKVLLAAFMGHVAGRIAYSSHCDEKLRHLPSGSRLGNVLREHHAKNSNKTP